MVLATLEGMVVELGFASVDALIAEADRYADGVLDPVERVHHPADGAPPTDYLATRDAAIAWMVAGGLDPTCPADADR